MTYREQKFTFHNSRDWESKLMVSVSGEGTSLCLHCCMFWKSGNGSSHSRRAENLLPRAFFLTLFISLYFSLSHPPSFLPLLLPSFAYWGVKFCGKDRALSLVTTLKFHLAVQTAVIKFQHEFWRRHSTPKLLPTQYSQSSLGVAQS